MIKKSFLNMSINEMRAGYGYGDYLSDIGNVSQEVRHGMWALTPQSVDDIISEEIELTEQFEVSKETLEKGVSRELADTIANKIAAKRGYQQLNYLGSGMFGSAYDIGDDKVLKITSDHTEANESIYLKNKPLERIAQPYEVSKINIKGDKDLFVIVLEKLRTNHEEHKKQIEVLDDFFEENVGSGYADIIGDYFHYGWDKNIETIDFRRFMENNPESADFFYNVLAIADELKKYGVTSMDFVSHNNLGYKKDGTLAFFDVGFGDYFQRVSQDIQSIEIEEEFAGGGGTKYATDNNVSSDGLPTYNNIDTSPSIHNDLNANSALYESPIPYGRTFWAWVSPENTFHIVPKLNHKDFIMRKYKDEQWGWDYDKVFDTAIQDGWVRVIYEYFPDRFKGELSLNGYNKQRVKDVFIKMFYDLVKYGNNTIYIDYENPRGTDVFSTYSQETKDELIDYISEDLEYKHVDDATKDEFVIFENIQRMDKEFVKSGIFTEQDRENVLEITNGDNYTFDVAKMYDFYMQISNPNIDRYPVEDFDKYVKNQLIILYNELRNYNSNVIPIKDMDNLNYGIDLASGLKYRKYIVDFLKSIPSVYLRNLKNDIRTPRTPDELQYGGLWNKYIPIIKSRLKQIQRLNRNKQEKILSKVFSSKNDTFQKVAEQMEKLDILFLHHDDGVEELRNKANYEAEHGEADILYDNGEVIVVSVKSSDAMKNLGCGSQWCFVTEYNTEHWKGYSHTRNVNIVYNFNEEPDSRKRMVVILADDGIYDMYNEGMGDGDEYLRELGVNEYINAGTEPAVDYEEEDEDVLNERKKDWVSGSQSVEVKRECQLGGKGDGTSKACNQGDINNLVLKTIQEYFGDNENITNFATNEGVGDEYLKSKHPNQFGDDGFEEKYLKYSVRDVDLTVLKTPAMIMRGSLKKHPIYVNPTTLRKFQRDVRGIVLENGDYYVAGSNDVLHQELVIPLFKNKIISLITPQDIYKNPEKYITVIRRGLGDTLELSTSYVGNDMEHVKRVFEKAYSKSGGGVKFKAVISKTDSGVNENISNFATDEGVGDRYLARREPGRFPDDEFSDFDVKYNKKKIVDSGEEIVFDKDIEEYPQVGNVERVTIVKNPKNLSNFGANVRGIIDKEGNLFVETMPTVIHNEIIAILSTLGFINVQKNWDNEVPKEFLTVQRGGNKNQFFVGHSYNTLRKNSEIFKETFIAILQFFRKARIKNPRYIFIPEMEKFYGKRDLRKMLMDLDKDNNVISEQISTLNELPFKQEIENLGGKIFSVGGAVRDEFLGKESKDLDVLITGVPMDELEQILSNYGRVDAVGKSFGVLKFRPEGSDEEIDIAIPRTEKATGDGGHKGFDVTSDHELPIEKDLLRRDFTINAIAKDISGNVVDPYNGIEDLQNKVIRVVNPDAFAEDPLRMLRAVQFASRFGFTIEPETMNLIKENASRIKEIPPERILIEFDKIVVKGNKRIGAELLVETGLYQNIFGVQASEFPDVFDRINTMGEFIFTICSDALNNCADFYKNKLKGEIDTYKEIKSYEFMKDKAYTNSVLGRSVAHNMYLISPQSLKSQILPIKLRVAASELLHGKYPKTVNELAVSGNDLMQIGLQGKQIGDMQKNLLLKIYNDNVQNNKEILLTLAGEIMSSNELNEIVVNNNNNNNKRREDKPILYSGVILEESSRQRLLRAIKIIGIEIPDDWKIITHHVTIAFAQKIPDKFTRMNMYLNGKLNFMAETVAMDDMVIAVGVSGVESLNKHPHVTIAVNKNAGAEPKMSNNLTNWIPLKRPLRLVGKVEEVELKR